MPLGTLTTAGELFNLVMIDKVLNSIYRGRKYSTTSVQVLSRQFSFAKKILFLRYEDPIPSP